MNCSKFSDHKCGVKIVYCVVVAHSYFHCHSYPGHLGFQSLVRNCFDYCCLHHHCHLHQKMTGNLGHCYLKWWRRIFRSIFNALNFLLSFKYNSEGSVSCGVVLSRKFFLFFKFSTQCSRPTIFELTTPW